MSEIKNVIDNDYCIGCGACTVLNNQVSIKRNEFGLKTATYNKNTNFSEADSFVCPFATPINESTLGSQLFKNTPDIKHNSKLGYYLDLYAGKVNDKDIRINTSSGGLISWLLCYLLENNYIDGIIHVKSSINDKDLFRYTISKNIQEILERGKSRYYHVSFDDVNTLLQDQNLQGRYVFIGVPCYIKAIRLLSEKIPRLKKHIIYHFALFCGHMKTSSFAELLAWQQGTKPSQLSAIDFRIKNLTGLSSNYSILSESKQKYKVIEKNNRLYGTDWGLGFFKPKACDWCDDISGELADITLGDAWLPEYEQDPLGTNIVIVRNSILNSILLNNQKNETITLQKLPEEKIIQSQAGNYRHRHEGLSVRIENAENKNLWFPVKRIKANDYDINDKRKQLYLVREDIAMKSHHNFLLAKQKKILFLFALKMFPLEIKYHFYNNRLVKGFIKSCLNLLTINFKKGKQQ